MTGILAARLFLHSAEPSHLCEGLTVAWLAMSQPFGLAVAKGLSLTVYIASRAKSYCLFLLSLSYSCLSSCLSLAAMSLSL